ncbi:hypothetical protein [Verrucosispora sp. WMMA2044]|uniref:hypothetical protein n=1 Tax=Verrucosispora sp. WMMA2044 TaxID=3016419 RepID=UPI0032B1013F
MLRLVRRRARAQWPLLAALVGIVTVGATLLGTCTLLSTRTTERALEVAMAHAAPAAVDVTVYTGTVEGRDTRSVAADTRVAVTAALDPFPVTTSARASTVLRALPPALAPGTTVPAQAYLSGLDDLPTRAELVTGRWPRDPGDTVLLESTAQLLGLAPGRRVRLGAELAHAPVPAIDVTVVGVVRPLPGRGWDRDPLGAAGSAAGHQDGRFRQPVNAYGPFLVDLADLVTTGATVDRMEVTAHPDLSQANRRDLETVAGAVRGADRRLAAVLGDRVRLARVASDLPMTLRSSDDQRHVTAAVVLAVAVLGGVLTATALVLAGRLTAGVRADETALRSALGTSRRQLAATATLDAVVAAVAAALSIPASSAVHAGLTHLPPLDGAGLTARPAITGVQVLAVTGGALVLAAVLTVLAIRPGPAPGAPAATCWPGPAPTCCSRCSPPPAGGSCTRSPPPPARAPTWSGSSRRRCCSPRAPPWRCGWCCPPCAASTGWRTEPVGWRSRWLSPRPPAGPRRSPPGCSSGWPARPAPSASPSTPRGSSRSATRPRSPSAPTWHSPSARRRRPERARSSARSPRGR